jgi:hypothetical protein
MQPVDVIPLGTQDDVDESLSTSCKHEVLVQDYECNIVVSAVSHGGSSRMSLGTWTKRISETSADEPQSPHRLISILQGVSVKTFIGVHSNSAVFLDDDLWVCSVGLGATKTQNIPAVQRHFFVPLDFLREITACRPLITPKGDIAFAKGEELAIVQGGLDWVFN